MPTMRHVATAVAVSTAPLLAQLAGVYTVNPTLPTAGINYTSLADATAALAAQTVVAPVTFYLFDDAGPYTEASTFTAASAGGTYGVPVNATPTAVLVMGSWNGTSATNRVTFEPAPGEHVVFDATGRSCGVFWGGADFVTLRGIEIANAAYDGVSLYAEASHGIAQDPIIDGCRIHDIGGPAVTIYGNTPQPTNTLVQNCVMWHCQTVGGGPFSTTGRFGYVTTRRSNGTRVVHNTFYVDTLFNSGGYAVLGAYPSSTTEVPYAEVSNNIVVKLAGSMGSVFRINPPAGSAFPVPVVCDSNCFFDQSGGTFALYGNPLVTAPLLVDWQTGALRDLASLAQDPQLRDPAHGEIHLLAASPCRGASTVAAGVAFDIDGQARSGASDLGADQYSAADYAVRGTGCPGTGGVLPVQALYGWPFLGNPTLGIGVERMPPNGVTALFGSLGASPVAIPLGAGCDIWLDPATTVGLNAAVAGPGGSASFVFAVPNSAAYVGFDIAYQSVVLDAGAPLGITLTNAVDVVFAF